MEKPRTASNETMKSGLDHATDVWLDEGSEPPRKAPRMVIVEREGYYNAATEEADPHHFRHLTDDEIRTRTTDFAVCEAGTPASMVSPPPWKAAEIEEELKLAAEREVQALHTLDESGIV